MYVCVCVCVYIHTHKYNIYIYIYILYIYIYIYIYMYMCVCVYIHTHYTHINIIYIYTVGTESIQTPLHFSLFVILQPFAKIHLSSFFFLINVHTAPHINRKTQNCWHFCRFIKKEKLKYHMVLSIQTLCCDTHIFNSGAVHFFWSSLRWFYTFIWVQLCLIILIGLD